MQTMLSLDNLEGCVIQTAKDRWLKVENGLVYNEFKQILSIRDDDCPIKRIEKNWPYLREGEWFEMTSPVKRSDSPFFSITFRTEQGLYFRCSNEHYKLEIPFIFASTDPRVGDHRGKWRSPSGKVINLISKNKLMIYYQGEKPVLVVASQGEIKSL